MQNKNVAYLGPKATFCNEAAVLFFHENNHFIPSKNIDDVFKKVINQEADYGVVPAENSIGGTIVNTLDLFIKTDLKIYDQISINIKQNLLSNASKEEIKTIYTHQQSYFQCTQYIFKNFPKAEFVETTSNAQAAIYASKDPTGASIGPILCASEYGLNILEKNINDFLHNETKFYIISHTSHPQFKERSMIIFSVPNKSGSLFNVLKAFKKYKINMTRIESRPSKIKKWDYLFIIEFENGNNPKNVLKLLNRLEHLCIYFNLLGSY